VDLAEATGLNRSTFANLESGAPSSNRTKRLVRERLGLAENTVQRMAAAIAGALLIDTQKPHSTVVRPASFSDTPRENDGPLEGAMITERNRAVLLRLMGLIEGIPRDRHQDFADEVDQLAKKWRRKPTRRRAVQGT
jgi:hypothetical protein